MYATLHKYRLNPIFERDFIITWTTLVNHLERKEMVKSGTLHKESRISYIGYVNWQSKKWYDKIRADQVEDLSPMLNKLRDYCNNIQELHRMEVIPDNFDTYNET